MTLSTGPRQLGGRLSRQGNDQFGAVLIRGSGPSGLSLLSESPSQEDKHKEEEATAENSKGDSMMESAKDDGEILVAGWNHKYSDPLKRNAGTRVIHAEATKKSIH